MTPEKKNETIKRIKFLSEEITKKKSKIEKEISEVEKFCYEIIELQQRIENNEQDNSI